MEKMCTRYGDCPETVQERLDKVNDKFRWKVFINDGVQVEAKCYKKYVIFDFDIVKHLIYEYCKLSCSLGVWTGCEQQFAYLVSLDFTIRGRKCSLKIHTSAKLMEKFHCRHEQERSLRVRRYRWILKTIKKPDPNMSAQECNKMKDNNTGTHSRDGWDPFKLSFFVKFIKRDLGQDVSTNDPIDFSN
ncbi:hypothetical protein I9W82_001328 [Candida metapsilosis]|uniref:Uncharacterized protein n=1 Tax=Candida metapsilosis TaxID=273372 RepID=A0A8H7ZI89_9ASCO|nr:hypothetical protein I9W82_001328 [Candida metapsilosis]